MPNQSLIAVVTTPVRPNSTTSAMAMTKGGVMIGRIDMTSKILVFFIPPRWASSAKARPSSVESAPARRRG